MDKALASGGKAWGKPKTVGSSPIKDVFFLLFLSPFFFTKHVLNKNQILFQILLKVS